MSETTLKFLNDAKAGKYKPGIKSTILDIVQNEITVPVSTSSDVTLLDISFYQETADFAKMLNVGVSGVIIRAGQNKWEDTCARKFMTDAELAGMPVGSYWFYDSRVSPQEQAEKWKSVLGNHPTQLMCWADYEESYGGAYSGWKKFYDFLEACKSKMPERKFGIYTGYYYWLEHSPLTTVSLNYFAEYPLWEAWYTNDVSNVKIPKPWTKMNLWQKTSSGDGSYYGVGSKEVDVDQFIGTKEEFNSFFGIDSTTESVPPVTTPEEKPVTFYIDLKSYAVSNLRSGPGTSYSILEKLVGYETLSLTGNKINGSDMYDWYEVVVPKTGFIAVTSNYTNLRSVSEAMSTQVRAAVVWDDENPDYNYKCRTQQGKWKGPNNPPAVMRFYPEPKEKSGDFRVDLSKSYDWKTAIIKLNGNSKQKFNYLTGKARATYNKTGWAKQAYITMSSNILEGEFVGDWFKFKTLKPSDLYKVSGITIDTHPQYVHRFTCVTWDKKNKATKRIPSTGTPRGQVYFFLVTNEGYAYIPKKQVRVI